MLRVPECAIIEEKKRKTNTLSLTLTVTGMLLAEAAVTLLQSNNTDDLAGGIYTPSFLGQEFIDRLDRAGFHFETKIIDS